MESLALAAVHAEVGARFSAATPRPWPAPRSGHDGPSDEEYSRYVAPQKYVLTQQRAAAWAAALVAAGVATSQPLGPQQLPPWGAVVTTSLTPTRPGAEPVFLHFSSEHLPGVIVAYGSPGVVLTAQPACGCDACDDGSDPLLQAIDEAFDSVVLSEVLIEHGRRSARVRTLDADSTSSSDQSQPGWVTGRWNGAAWLD